MVLTNILTSKSEFGLFEVVVLINQKPYSYRLNSEWAVRKFQTLFDKGWNGKALNVLKKFNLKEH